MTVGLGRTLINCFVEAIRSSHLHVLFCIFCGKDEGDFRYTNILFCVFDRKAICKYFSAIDYMSAFSSIDEALQRVHQIDIRAVEHECVSNLVHCIAPLLMSEPYKMVSFFLFFFVFRRFR